MDGIVIKRGEEWQYDGSSCMTREKKLPKLL